MTATHKDNSTEDSIPLPVLERAVEQSQLFAQAHGMFMRSFPTNNKQDSSQRHYTLHTLPYTLLPTLVPIQAHSIMVRLGPVFNRLVDAMARDAHFVLDSLAQTRKVDQCLTGRLCDLLERKLDYMGLERFKAQTMLGIFRADYMLHEGHDPQLVELNTIAAGMCGQSQYAQEMHRNTMEMMQREGVEPMAGDLVPSESLHGVVDAIYSAHMISCHRWKKSKKGTTATRAENGDTRDKSGANGGNAVVLFVVQPRERNVFDHKHLEHGLWRRYGVGVVRMTLTEATDALFRDDNDELVIRSTGQLVSVVYFRSGYGPGDYPSDKEWSARMEIELSNAIKCPTVEYQLVGTKKMQQIWSTEGVLERFLPNAADVQQIRNVLTGTFALDDPLTSPSIIEHAVKHYKDYVLKPQREGGGNLVFGERVVEMLSQLTDDDAHQYILMRRIRPKPQRTILVHSADNVETVNVITEIGFYSTLISNGTETNTDCTVGYLVRAKKPHVEEGGFMSGSAFFSSIQTIP